MFPYDLCNFRGTKREGEKEKERKREKEREMLFRVLLISQTVNPIFSQVRFKKVLLKKNKFTNQLSQVGEGYIILGAIHIIFPWNFLKYDI